jgi:molybdopterin molybdotransferase
MLGTNGLANIEKQAILLNDLPANGERKHFMRGFKKDGFIEIFSKQDSSLLSILQKANTLVIRAPNEPALKKGNQIGYFELD